MNKYISALVLVLAALLSSCEKPVEEILTLGRTSYSASSDGGKFSMSVTHSADYTVSVEGGSWITAETNGAEKNTLVVNIAANDEYNAREGRVVISMGSLTAYVEITQAQKNAIVVSQDEYEVDCDEGELKLVLGSNISYNMQIEGSWLKQVETKAYEENELVFSYTANMKAEPRTAYIRFSSGNIEEMVTVVQKERVMEYVLSFTHDAVSLTGPVFSGSIISGTIYWGDGNESMFTQEAKHDYVTAQEYEVKMVLQGGVDAQTVTFKNIIGIKEIDLSKL